jgi:hypothetical protein
MADWIAASLASRRVAEATRAVLRDAIEDTDSAKHVEEAERELVKLASAMGYSVMQVNQAPARRARS